MRAVTTLRLLLTEALAELELAWPAKTTLEPPKDVKFGDLAANVAMVAAKAVGKPPRVLAEEIAAKLRGKDGIESVEVAGPGFLNVRFTLDFWQKTIIEVLTGGPDYGRGDEAQGQNVQVEFVSANPTGPLHIGHGRGAALGDSLARVLDFAGHKVTTEYYVNDAGRQMKLLGLSLWVRYQEINGKEVTWPEDWYKGEYMIDLARAFTAQVRDSLFALPEAEALARCQQYASSSILQGIKEDLEVFRVHHQVWFSELSLVESGEVEKTLEWLTAEGLAYEKDGALWMNTERFGDDKDRVLRKSNGDLTYFASDIAYHKNKYDRGFDKVVDIWGFDHHGYKPRMAAAVAALGRAPEAFEVLLVQLVNLLRAGEPVAMSTRSGEFETLADVVKDVGVDAARFMFLSRKSDSHLDFDLEAVKSQSMDNPVYYVQYAHARVHSLVSKAKERGLDVEIASKQELELLTTAEDLALMRLMEQFPDQVQTAASELAPHQLSFYLRELANTVHRYYSVHHVLDMDKQSLSKARLTLLRAVAQVVHNGLALLGVSAPVKM